MNDVLAALRVLVLPLVAGAVVGVAALVPDPTAESVRPPSSSDVTQVRYACPSGPDFSVALGQVRSGSEVMAELLPDRSPLDAQPDRWVVAEPGGDGIVIDHRGNKAGAAGFFGRSAPAAVGGGLIVGDCPATFDDAWFVGLGSGGKHQSSLVLTNVADTPAVVSVRLWRPAGEVETVGADEIVIDPFTVRRVRLADIAAGELELAAQVRRTRGAVSVVANDNSTATFKGTEAVSSVDAPSRDQILGGVTEGASGRTLLLLNPSSATARVTVSAIGSEGSVVPEGLESIKLKPEELKVIDVPRAAGSEDLALRLTSDEPVVAAVRLSPTTTDFAYAEASSALSGPALIPVDVGQDLPLPNVILTAPDRKARATFEAFDGDMASLGTVTVKVPKDTTQAVDLASEDKFDADEVVYLVVTPKGRLYAAATYVVDDKNVASLALRDAPVLLTAPDVRPASQP